MGFPFLTHALIGMFVLSKGMFVKPNTDSLTSSKNIVALSNVESSSAFVTKFQKDESSRSGQNLSAVVDGTFDISLDGRKESEVGTAELALVDFILERTSGRHFSFLYDEVGEDISVSAVRRIQRYGDVNVFQYDSQLLALKAMIRGFYHTGSVRNVLVLCSPEHTKDIFKKVTEGNLQSATLHWFVIVQDDVRNDITKLIKEGTQITLALKTKGQYDFFLSYVNSADIMSFEIIGWWKWPRPGPPETKSKFLLTKPLYTPPSEVYLSFRGRVMVNAVIDNSPFFKIEVQPDGYVKPISGIDYNLLNTLGGYLNFTYELVVAEDGQWGGEMPNGSFTGMIGKVQSGIAHFAINEITITGPRERVIDFTLPYFLESTALISPAPAQKNQAFAVFSPFTFEVWLLIVAATLLMGPLITAMTWLRSKYHVGRLHSLSTHSFTVYRSLVVQGNLLKPTGWCQRGFYIGWFYFCFIIYALYAGTLTAVLTVPAYEKPIDSLWDLYDAVVDDDFKPIVVIGTSNEFIFSLATDGIYKQLWDVFDPDDRYVNSWSEGIAKVLTGKYAYANAYLGALIRAKRRGLHNYYFSKTTFYPQSYGIACPNGSPYTTLFSELLIRMWSAGLVQKWTNDEVAKVKSEDDTGGSSGPGAITLVHLQAAFFILLMGYSLASVALIGEGFASMCYKKPKEPSKKMMLQKPR